MKKKSYALCELNFERVLRFWRVTVDVIILSLLLFGCATSPRQPSPPLIERFTTAKAYADVVDELDFAITERNFRITGRNVVGKGIRKRGYNDFPDMEVIHFCSLDYAREVLEIAPGFIAQMPCRITVHEQNNEVVISLILLPEDHPDGRVKRFARWMNGMLRDIVEFALEENAL